MLIGIFFGGLENISIRQMDGGGKAFCETAPIGLNRADHRGRGIGLQVEAMLHDGFDSHGAGDFTVRFTPHAVGKHVEVQRLNDLVTVFVVRTHATQIGHAATGDSHANSPCPRKATPLPTRVPGNSAPTLTEPRGPRKAVNPTDYSLFRHRGSGEVARPLWFIGECGQLGIPAFTQCVPTLRAYVILSVSAERPASAVFCLSSMNKNTKTPPEGAPRTRRAKPRGDCISRDPAGWAIAGPDLDESQGNHGGRRRFALSRGEGGSFGGSRVARSVVAF